MPLINKPTKAAFKRNVETEMESGKPKAQSLAIAYDVNKRSKRKKMAEGGGVMDAVSSFVKGQMEPEKKVGPGDKGYVNRDLPKEEAKKFVKGFTGMAEGGKVRPKMTESILRVRDRADVDADMMKPKHMDEEPSTEAPIVELELMAEGGGVDAEEAAPSEEYHDSLASAIMAKRRKMAEGGSVDIEENGQEQPNGLDELNEAALKENYDSDMEDITQPMDSNEQGHDIETDRHDRVGAIRRRVRSMR